MDYLNATGKPVHPAALMYAEEEKAGKLSRREFLSRATALGLTATAAYGLLGLDAPAQAANHVQNGGTVRVQSEVRAMKDPRTWDWTQISNFGRGWLEWLVEYNRDGTFRGMLLEGWEANDDATQYLLRVRPGVTWNNGDAFTAEHVASVLNYWCDKAVEGNSMAGRMGALIDDTTNQARAGAIEVVDDMTVRLTLQQPDISIIPNMADYPAAVVHPDHNPDATLEQALGTGPYLPELLEVGVRGVLVKNPNHTWWGTDAEGVGGATLDRIEYIDYGTDPAAWVSAMESDEVDMIYQNVNEFIDIGDAIGWEKSEVVTGSTLVLRFNQLAEVSGMVPYSDVRVRQALMMAVDNNVLLELGYAGLGVKAENHHVAPVHPEYADIGPAPHDPSVSVGLLEEAGMADFEHELITIDDGFQRNTGDAAAAQMRDAGIKVKRTVLPGSTFWNDWTKYPLSITEWNHRPLGVQILALAYRSGEPWNEAAYSNETFDAKLAIAMSLVDADERREVMAEIQQILVDDAVIIQPYWRSLYRHYRPGVTGAEMHPAFEIHPYKLGLSA
jgi:peptide/nickel transport system substrate-binding protein